jgi:FkbM family methyltransferase
MIDVGANIGNHTVALAQKFDQVESVEPHPILFHILTANVLRNHLTNVTIHNFGLANEDTEATLANPAESHGAAMVKDRSLLSQERVGRTEENWGEEFTIQLRSAPAFLRAFGDKLNGAFIKIDVEGMEQEIVTAMMPVLEEYKPVVGFEWFTEDQPNLGRLVASLDGYELWGIHSLDEVGPNLALRAMKLLAKGREIRLAPIDLDNPARVYTLALLVPKGKLG